MSTINTSNISIDDSGKVTFSGVSSSINSTEIIEATITAKRVQAVQYETKISDNNEKISAYAELKTLTTTITNSLNNLRGSTSYFSTNAFDSKTATGTTTASATAAAGYIPSDTDSLISAAVTADAETGSHTIVINQTAQAHQLRSDAFTSKTDTLDSLGITLGDISINGQTITVDNDDSLLDLRSKINAADAGVTASIVTANDTEHYLVLTSTETGAANAISFGVGSTTNQNIGFVDGTDAIKNELQEALDANLTVDGITNVTRSTNEIDDIIEGVTLSLFQAEADTVITLNIETDLNSVKTELVEFVNAYNDLRSFIDDQRSEIDRNDDGEEEYGALAFDNTLRRIANRLSEMVSTEVSSLSDGFQSLSQVGITMNADYQLVVDDDILDNKLLTNVEELRKLFEIDVTSSDSRVQLVDRSSDTVAGTYTLNIGGTDASGNIISANINGPADGSDDGSVTVSGKTLTATNATNAEGLNLLFNGASSLGIQAGISVTVSRGLADLFYDGFNDLTKASGELDTLTTDLEEQNTDYETRIDTIDARLEITRATLERQYIAMETALAQLESLREQIQAYFNQDSNNNN